MLAISSELPIVDCQLIRFGVISEEEARRRILEKVSPLDERAVPLAGALDCFAAQDYFARLPLPAFDNSAMDGYAVVASSCKKGGRLRVIGEQPAGPDRKLRVGDGEAVRIFTGAPLPQGADAIVMQEDVTRDGTDISLNVDVEAGEFVRRRGCDLAEGQMILARGERIRAATVALLASQGFADVIVGGKATAAVISTGDELVKPGEELQPGQIYDSNSALLNALLLRCGVSATAVEHCRDDRQSLDDAIKRGIKNHVLIISGGVSVGEHDLVKEALRELGAKIEIWRVAVKPGKPFLFGRVAAECTPSPQSSPSGRERRTRSAGEGSVSTQVLRLWAARKSRVGVRDVFAVRPAGDFKNDGRNEPRPAAGSGEVGGWPNERRRSTALHPRETRTRKVHADRSSGIARAFWFEPGKCVAAGRGRSVVESR